MAIAASVSDTVLHWTGVGATSDTKAFTGGASDTVLLVNVGTNQTPTATGATYVVNAMTLIDSYAVTATWRIYVFAYVGTIFNSAKNIVVSFSSSIGYYDIAIQTLSGTAATIPTNKTKNYTNSNSSTYSSNAVTTAYDNSWVMDAIVFGSDGGTDYGSSSGGTLLANAASGPRVSWFSKLVTPAGAYTGAYTVTGVTEKWSSVTFEVNLPIAASGGLTPISPSGGAAYGGAAMY